MSCWRKQAVLRVPAKTFGIWHSEAWYSFREAFEDQFRWEPGHFAPAQCTHSGGYFLDYFLEDEAPVDYTDGEFEARSRELTPEEAQRYLPAFRELFPQFGLREMADVRYCAYVWYDGADAPYCY